MPVIDDAAVGIAAALCLTARLVDRHGVTGRHPRRCGWCDYPTDELQRMVDGFNAWAGWDERKGTYARHDVRVFADLRRTEQARLVTAAQELEPEPMPSPEGQKAHAVTEEETTPWL